MKFRGGSGALEGVSLTRTVEEEEEEEVVLLGDGEIQNSSRAELCSWSRFGVMPFVKWLRMLLVKPSNDSSL